MARKGGKKKVLKHFGLPYHLKFLIHLANLNLEHLLWRSIQYCDVKLSLAKEMDLQAAHYLFVKLARICVHLYKILYS